MIRTECDQCDRHIGKVAGDWYALDHVRLDDDGEIPEPHVVQELHFCSADCLQQWAFAQAFDPQDPSTKEKHGH